MSPSTAGSQGADQAGTQISTRAAILLPLTGRFSDLGNAMLDAAQLAVFDMADQGFELMVFDTRGDAEGASTAARQAVERGARLIIGPLLSSSTRSAAQWSQVAAVPMLSFSSDRTVAGNGIFVLGFTPSDQVERVVQYALGRDIDRFALIAPDDAYGGIVARALRETVQTAGGQIAQISLTDRRDPDFARSLSTIAPSLGLPTSTGTPSLGAPSPTSPGPLPALMLAEGGERLRGLATVLTAQDLGPGRVQLLGTGTWDEDWIGGQRSLVGGWFAAPPPQARSRFVQSFSNAYGRTPPRLAGLAYDAAALAAVLGRDPGGAGFTEQTLTAPSGFLGSEGIFRLRTSGVAERGLAVLEVKPWGVDVISDAPQSFAGI